jgi:hypothetical protein
MSEFYAGYKKSANIRTNVGPNDRAGRFKDIPSSAISRQKVDVLKNYY